MSVHSWPELAAESISQLPMRLDAGNKFIDLGTKLVGLTR
jgi:hypothetical protein